jgi:hypothetical protein
VKRRRGKGVLLNTVKHIPVPYSTNIIKDENDNAHSKYYTIKSHVAGGEEGVSYCSISSENISTIGHDEYENSDRGAKIAY